jgi:hypothetical protein
MCVHIIHIYICIYIYIYIVILFFKAAWLRLQFLYLKKEKTSDGTDLATRLLHGLKQNHSGIPTDLVHLSTPQTSLSPVHSSHLILSRHD